MAVAGDQSLLADLHGQATPGVDVMEFAISLARVIAG